MRLQRGYNLIEVLIAMALFGTVLLSIITLFVAGRSNVYGGKTMSQGVAVATHAMEDISSLSLEDMQTAFGIADADEGEPVDVDPDLDMDNDNYALSILRTTEDISGATDPGGYMQNWLDEIEADNKMAQAYVAVVITPSNPTPVGDPLTVGNATLMRVRVLVRWQTGLRWRQVVLDTVKVRRP